MGESTIRIFVSSPGDVSHERGLAFRVIKRLQRDFVEHFRLIPVFWEKLPLEAVECFQTEIERISSPTEADVVVFILWSRLGTPLGPKFHKPDGSPYGSGTEYEFEVSLQSRRDTGKPAILVYIKEAPIDPGKFSRNEVQQLSEILAQTHKVKDFIEHNFYDPGEQVFIRSFHTFNEPPSFESLLEDHLRELLSQYLPEGAAARPLWEGTPFRGLQVFNYQHEDIFLGRSQAVMEIMNLLQRQVEAGCAFVLILGRSGSGKSSLVRAGVLPLLTRYGALPEVKVWRWAVITPSQSPGDLFEGLAAGILGPTALPETHASRGAELAQVMRESPAAALLLLRDCLGRLAPAASETEAGAAPACRLVLVIDQLEEIFNDDAVPSDQRQAYVHLLLSLARSGLVWVLATLRSDYYQRCAELPDLMALKKDGTYDLAPPNPAELQQIITRPAAMAGLRFELHPQSGEPLDHHIFNATIGMEAGLPLLEYTLEELYERRTPGGWLTYQAYDDLGGVEGALGQRAEAVFAALEPEVQAAFPEVFQELTAIAAGEIERVAARSASWDDVSSTPPRRQLLEAMVAARLFSADSIKDSSGTGRAVVRVAHEALFRAWKRLQDWLEQEKENLRVRSRVAVAADRWQAESRRPDLLLPAGKPLEEALPLVTEGRVKLPPAEQEFILASQTRARRFRRLKQTAVALLIVLTFLAGAGAYLASERSKVALSRQLVAQANNLLTRQARMLSRSILLSLESLELRRSCEGIKALSTGLALLPRWWADLPQGSDEKGKSVAVINVVFSPDGNWVATIGTKSPEVMIWEKGENYGKWNHRKTVTHKDRVWDLAFSQDGKYLATVGFDNHVRVWNRDKDWDEIPSSMQHQDVVFAVAFYQNEAKTNTWMATGSKDGTVKVWNLPEGQEISQQRIEGSEIFKLTYDPKGKLLATAHTNGEAHLWRMEGNNLIAFGEPLKHDQEVGAVAFSPDGQWFATASYDCKVRVWQLQDDSKIIKKAEMWHNGQAGHVAFSPDSAWLVTGSMDGTARIWETKTWTEISRLVHEPGLREKKAVSIAVAPNGKLVATGAWDGTARVWDPLTGKELKRMEHEKQVSWVAFSPDSKLLLSGSWDRKTRVWEVDDCVTASEPPEKGLKVVILSSDNKRIATGGTGQKVKVWDTINNCLIDKLEAGQNEPTQPVPPPLKDHGPPQKDDSICRTPVVISLAFDQQGSRVACGGEDGKSRVWDVKDEKLVGEVLDHKAYVWSVALSPDGKLLATGAGDTVVRLWELKEVDNNKSWKFISSEKHLGKVTFLAFSMNGELLVSGDMTGQIKIHDLKRNIIKDPTPAHYGDISAVAFSRDPEGKMLATGGKDKKIKIWDSKAGKLIAQKELDGEVIGIAFNRDGEYLSTADRDGTVQVFKISLQRQELDEESRIASDDMVLAVAFNDEDNGKHLLITGKDHTLRKRLWRMEDLREKAFQILPKNRHKLNPDEKKLYGISG